MMIKLSSRAVLFRSFLALALSSGAFLCCAQDTFTDGLSWVSGSVSTSAQSPVFSGSNCNDIHYTISTTSNLGFNYDPVAVNGSGVLFPGFSNSAGNAMSITITFNVPVSNFAMRILDLDEDNMFDGGIAEEYLTNISPAPSSISTINGINPMFLSGTTITPEDNNASNNNNNTGAWVYFPGQVTTLNFTYNRAGEGYEFVLDSLHFECACPSPSNHIDDAMVCPNQSSELNATTANATSYLWSTGSTNAAIQADSPGTYWVNVFIGSCMESDTAIIGEIPTPGLHLGNDTTFCEGGSVTLATPGLSNVTWQNGTIGNTFLVTTPGIYYATANFNGCALRDTIVIGMASYPTVDLGPDTEICEASSYILNAPSGFDYLWSNGSIASEVQITGGGSFWVRVSNGLCATFDTISVVEKALPPSPLPGDTIICPGDNTTITLHTTTGTAYEWFNGSAENFITVSNAGSYWVESNLNGCSRTDTVHVSEYPSLDTIIFDSVVVVCEDKSALIGPATGSSLIEVEWQNGSHHHTIYVNGAGVYSFTASTPCETRDYSVRVEEERCFCTVYLPNAFTPDGQNGNEVFQPVYECEMSRFELVVFNRWGEIVFSATDPRFSWDGTFKGAPVPDGVYVYKMTYASGAVEEYKEITGHVTVLR